MCEVRITRSPSDKGICSGDVGKENLLNTESFLCQAIENAGGVPFQLIFGPGIGEGQYTKAGEGIRKLLGVSSEEITEKIFLSLIEKIIPLPGCNTVNPSEIREKFIKGEIKSYKAEVLIRMPDGATKWILDTSLPLREEGTSKIIGSYGILFDINDNKRISEKLVKAKKQAEESDRLKTAFIQNLSHEIRTPLNAIVGFSTLIGEPEYEFERRKEFMEIISRNADHLLEVISNIVEIANIEANIVKVKKEEVNINLVLQSVYERFRPMADAKGIFLNYTSSTGTDEVIIISDRSKLLQVLLNLAGNGLKFTSKGKVEFGYTLKNDLIEFYVSDTGAGIRPEHHPKVFSRFFQAESGYSRSYGGTGLGLSISKAYIKLLGGDIWFTSDPVKGSVFYFTIPVGRTTE